MNLILFSIKNKKAKSRFPLEKSVLLFINIIITQLLLSHSAEAYFSFGIKGGRTQIFSKLDTDYSQTDAFINGEHKNSTDIASRGFMGGVTLEQGTSIFNNRFYVGFVAGVNLYSVKGKDFRTADSSNVHPGGKKRNNIEIKKNYSFDISTKLGYYCTESVLTYLKLGISRSQYELNSHIFTDNVVGVGYVDNKKTFKKYFLSFKPAMGIEVYMSKNISFGIEYSHEISERKSLIQQYDPVGIRTQELPHVLKPQTGTVAVFVNYKFGRN